MINFLSPPAISFQLLSNCRKLPFPVKAGQRRGRWARTPRRQRRFLRLQEVGNDFDFFGRNAHADMLALLGFAQGDPLKHFFEQRQRADISRDEPHPSAFHMAVVPASRGKRRPEIARKTALARLPVIQKKAVHAGEAIIIQVMYDGHVPLHRPVIHDRRHDRKDVMDLPFIEMPGLLVLLELGVDFAVVSRFPGNGP